RRRLSTSASPSLNGTRRTKRPAQPGRLKARGRRFIEGQNESRELLLPTTACGNQPASLYFPLLFTGTPTTVHQALVCLTRAHAAARSLYFPLLFTGAECLLRHSGLIPASRMTLAQRMMSALMRAAVCSGVLTTGS